ncbi:alpha/beta hydrolase [Vaginella massiliensis]|uniref:alpha/beta hydrolase n=1 Tax=Vaginella massiliensis TaxID=1816680 RepID=UPI001EEB35AD|nr:alpha/beta hydrolase-fold protein [Vaginella massiliensis]
MKKLRKEFMKELKGIHYIERKPTVETNNPFLYLLIHGYGSNEEDLFSFANDLPAAAHVVSVRGRFPLIFGGFAWYELDFSSGIKMTNYSEGIDSKNALIDFIDAFNEQENLDPSNVWISGFSQGAILSYAIALSFPEKVKNVLILSGYPEREFIDFSKDNAAYQHLNFFVSHGTEDVVLPIEGARMGKKLLTDLGIAHEYHEYQSGHGIVPQNYFDMMNWIKKEL